MTTDLPVTSEQFEDDAPVVVVALDHRLPECDGYTVSLTPDRADALAAALTAKAADIRAGRRPDITYENGNPTP